MAKKLLSDAAASKLAPRREGGEGPHLGCPQEVSRRPKSFRLGPVHLERLRHLSERLSDRSRTTYFETEVLKGLLLFGEKADARSFCYL